MNDLVENYRLGDLVYGRDVFRKCYMKNLNSNIFCIIDQYNDVIADGLYGSEQTNTALGNTGLYKPIPNNMYLAALIADDNKYETLFSIIKSDFLKIAKHGSIASLIHISDDVSLSKVFLNSYIDLLLNDERKKFDLSTILKKIKDSFNKMGIKSVSDAVEHCSECSDVIYNILLKRLCRLGIEWCLINDKKLHFFIPNPNDTASWVSIIEKHPFKDPLGVIKVPFTTYELLFLLKRFERYKNTVIFYDEKNGKEIHQEKILPLTKQIKINKPESLCLYNKETGKYIGSVRTAHFFLGFGLAKIKENSY